MLENMVVSPLKQPGLMGVCQRDTGTNQKSSPWQKLEQLSKKKKKEVALHYDSNDKYSVVYIDRNKLLNK